MCYTVGMRNFTDAEKAARYRAKATPKEKKAWSEKNRKRHLDRLEAMTPEERAEFDRKSREYQQAYRSRTRPRRLAVMRKWQYGITQEQFDAMKIKCNGCCEGCGDPLVFEKWKFAVDHDHKTGRVRWLLCSGCNKALGLVKDNVATLLRLVAYLGPERE